MLEEAGKVERVSEVSRRAPATSSLGNAKPNPTLPSNARAQLLMAAETSC
jgi:hypothetical protein